MRRIILFYKYIEIENPTEILVWQKELCNKLNLRGRVILATEGINATVGGTKENIEEYKKSMNSHPLFGEIDFKESDGCEEDFPRMKIVIKNEIVHLGIDPKKLQAKDGGLHLSPEQTHQLIESGPENLVILDVRNNYESKIGKFQGAITPDIKYFRDFPKYINENINLFKEKEVLMNCTGGIRCERASALLKSYGVEKVYQLSGGIHRYIEKYPNGFFRGKNYVFDGRTSISANEDVLGSCKNCNRPCDDYTSCMNSQCNEHFISCKDCIEKLSNACSLNCKMLLEANQVVRRPARFRMPNTSQKNKNAQNN